MIEPAVHDEDPAKIKSLASETIAFLGTVIP
jgi:hypothetical protein